MKRLILFVAVVGLAGAAAIWLVRHNSTPAIPTQPVAEAAPAPEVETVVPENSAPPSPMPSRRNSATVQERLAIPESAPSVAGATDAATDEATALRQTVEMLISPQTSFGQKQAAWIKLRTEGKLNQVITELKRRTIDDPNNSEIHTTLGEALLNKVGAIHAAGGDVNEMGILAMQADQSFNAALKLDPTNWETQFVKYSTMFYWPPEATRDNEVAQKLSGLIDQQESLPQQPHFAQTYLALGNQYQKIGKPDFAEATWRLGLTKFPNDSMLLKMLSGQK